MKSDTNLQSIGLGIVGIIFIVSIIWIFFHELSQAPWQFITILVALLGALITFVGNYQLQIRNEQKEKKVETYKRLMELFFESLYASKLGKEPKNEEEIINVLYDITPELIFWASDDVLKLYIDFRKVAKDNIQSSPSDSIFLFGKMLIAIRKDLGHQNSNINEKSILSIFINDVENLSPKSIS